VSTLSVRQIAEICLGATGSLSVNRDVYGYIFRADDGSLFGPLDSDDILPGSGQATTRSLKRHLETVSAKATDLVLILVGHEPGFSGEVSRDQAAKTQYALQVTRDIYAQVSLGIRRIIWARIPLADAPDYVDIADRAEAQDLTDDWSGPDGGIDVFMVQTIGDVAGGWSDVKGACDKSAKSDLSGAVVELNLDPRITGIVLGHEVGHYMGLKHGDRITNLMGTDADGDGIGSIDDTSTDLTSGQGATMRGYCSVQDPC